MSDTPSINDLTGLIDAKLELAYNGLRPLIDEMRNQLSEISEDVGKIQNAKLDYRVDELEKRLKYLNEDRIGILNLRCAAIESIIKKFQSAVRENLEKIDARFEKLEKYIS